MLEGIGELVELDIIHGKRSADSAPLSLMYGPITSVTVAYMIP